MLKRLIGIAAALSVLVAAHTAEAAPAAQRFAAQSTVRQQAPKVRVAVQRPSARPTSYRSMSQQAQRPHITERVQPTRTRAEDVRPSTVRAEYLQVRQEKSCVPSRTCGRATTTPRAERSNHGNATKRQLAKDKRKRAKKF